MDSNSGIGTFRLMMEASLLIGCFVAPSDLKLEPCGNKTERPMSCSIDLSPKKVA